MCLRSVCTCVCLLVLFVVDADHAVILVFATQCSVVLLTVLFAMHWGAGPVKSLLAFACAPNIVEMLNKSN